MAFLRSAAVAQLLLAAVRPVLAQGSCPVPLEPRTGAVACESDICSKVGADILENGGNAVDSIVATTFCVGTVAMYHSGLGGGGFLVVRSRNGTYEFVDFRERAPAAAYEDMYVDDPDQSLYGDLAR